MKWQAALYLQSEIMREAELDVARTRILAGQQDRRSLWSGLNPAWGGDWRRRREAGRKDPELRMARSSKRRCLRRRRKEHAGCPHTGCTSGWTGATGR